MICDRVAASGYCAQTACTRIFQNSTLRKTNADRIRSMTDEELLDFMVKTIGNAVLCKTLGTEPKFCSLEWLQQPVEEELA